MHPVLVFTLKTAAGAGLLTVLVWYVDVQALIASIRSARPMYLAAGTALAGVNLAVQFARWKYLLRIIRVPAKNATVFRSLAAGFTAGFFTPGQIGEIGGRLFALDGRHRASILTMSAVDKLYILGVTIASGTLSAIIFFPLFLPAQWGAGLTAIAVMLLCAILIGFLFPSLTKSLLLRLPERIRGHRWYAVFKIFETDFHNSTGQWLMVLTAVLFGIIILQYHCFVNAFSPTPLTASALCVPIVLFVKSVILPISIGDLGIRESASVFFYARTGVPAAAALSASLCIFAVNIVVPALLGIMVLFTSHKR
jgi:uncharacterized membrane protein YbhN (UPF0104 family)